VGWVCIASGALAHVALCALSYAGPFTYHEEQAEAVRAAAALAVGALPAQEAVKLLNVGLLLNVLGLHVAVLRARENESNGGDEGNEGSVK
jgi:hypothetical protein